MLTTNVHNENCFEVNGCTSYFEVGSFVYSFLPPFSVWVNSLKERICSLRSKFFPFRANPILKQLHCLSQGCEDKVSVVVSFCKKTAEKNKQATLHLNTLYTRRSLNKSISGVSSLFCRFHSLFEGKILLANSVVLSHYVASDLGLHVHFRSVRSVLLLLFYF